jgi:DNA-binding SARP family transcriptional activator/EAL domain-containing protein (putative c-di-GMP-specific phosphodiesterase class I)/CheY-like chemotaxis protein
VLATILTSSAIERCRDIAIPVSFHRLGVEPRPDSAIAALRAVGVGLRQRTLRRRGDSVRIGTIPHDAWRRGPPVGSEHGVGHRIEIRLLGPFAVDVGGQSVPIGSVKQRAVLAELALNAGRVVTADTLCSLLWEKDPPGSPLATIQSLISRLRRTLGDRDVLRTVDPGWVLDADPERVDALRFGFLVAHARARAGRGDVDAAAADLTAALDLWRGPALVDLAEAGYLVTQAIRLDEARRDAVEDLAEAELRNGRTAEAVVRLETHVDAEPLRERGWSLLMLALYRLGRQAAALRAFQQARSVLRDELGVEPGPDLVAMEQRILQHDPTLAATTGEAPTAAVSAPPAEGEFADYRVLVVEDHDFQRRTVVQLLRGLGVGTVADAPDGVDALDALQSSPLPDVIVCDIDMPGMDGVEFVTHVAARRLAPAVIIASGLEANVLRAVEAIGVGHGLHVLAALEKPLTARSLGDALRRYTRLGRGVDDQRDVALSGDELRDALARGELTPEFEPRIDLSTGTITSVEASARWRDAEGSRVDVSVFSAALVREGLVPDFVAHLVAASGALVGGVGPAPLRVAVDLSLLPLADVSLADWLTALVVRRHHDPRHIVCQIDDLAMARAPAALEVLTRLRVKGFGLSMIHTGIGPSMAHLLNRVPLSELKLDRRLVSGASADPKRHEMLGAALTEARQLGLPVVADGCDEQSDFDTLVALGCSEAQGRFIGDPMAAAEVVDALAGGLDRARTRR